MLRRFLPPGLAGEALLLAFAAGALEFLPPMRGLAAPRGGLSPTTKLLSLIFFLAIVLVFRLKLKGGAGIT